MNYDELGELIGHISIGLEIVNSLWQKITAENAELGKPYRPASEDVRMHLLHLIGAHHRRTSNLARQLIPKTPEAMALHYIDDLDLKAGDVRGRVTQPPNRWPAASSSECGHCRGI